MSSRSLSLAVCQNFVLNRQLPLFSRAVLHLLLKIGMYALVAWGVVAAVRSSARQLDVQRAELERRATEVERLSESKDDGAEIARLKERAAALRRQVADFWKADWRLLLLAGVVYAVSLLPAALYWHRSLRWLGESVPWLGSLSVYLQSLLGKYVPGKAMVIVIRVLGLARYQVDEITAVTSALIETLTMMSVGSVLATLCLVGLSFSYDLGWWLTLLSAGTAVLFLLATMPASIRFVLSRRWRKGNSERSETKEKLVWTGGRMFFGWAILSFTWIGFAVSLALVLQSLAVTNLGDVPPMQFALGVLGASAVGVVFGFLSLLPGGAGAREVALSLVLTPIVGPTAALAGAVWLRIVWIATELILAGFAKVLQGAERGRAFSDTSR